MSGTLILRQRSRARKVDLRLLRRILRTLLADLLQRDVLELGIYVVDELEITRLNQTFLRHQGSTDVITFDYAEASGIGALAGEIFVCLDEARRQARHFRASWQSELVRCIVHGILHLCGYDDQKKRERVRMKREEDRLLRCLAQRFAFRDVALRQDRRRRLDRGKCRP